MNVIALFLISLHL